MVTITQTQTTERTLDTPGAILDHVEAEVAHRIGGAPFKASDRVRITNRAGIPPEFMAGDVGVVLLCDPAFSPLTTLMGLNAQGMTIQFPVQTVHLAPIKG